MFNLTKKKIAALSLVLFAPVGICIAQADAAGPTASNLIDKDFESAMRRFVSKRFYNRIDATEEQRQKLDSIITGTMDSTRPNREQLRQGILDFSALVASDDATDEQITQKAHDLRAMHEKVMDQRLTSLLQVRKVLSHDQRQKINERVYGVITGGLKPNKRVGFLMNRRVGMLMGADE